MTNPAVEFFSRTADDFAGEYDRSAEFKERHSLWTRLLDKYTSPHFRVFDMGCGSGVFSFYLAQRGIEVLGIDASEEMLEMCIRHKQDNAIDGVDFVRAELPLPSTAALGTADMIVCSSVLEYIDELERTLVSFYGLLNPRGILIFSLPNKNSIRRKLERAMFKIIRMPRYYRYVKNILTVEDAGRLLLRSGFSILESHYYGRWPALSRRSRKLFPPKYFDNLFVVVCQKIY